MKLRTALPCFPCPHKGVCCSAGTDLTDTELNALAAAYGEASVDRSTTRTAVTNGTCFFQLDGLCTLHASPLYPRVCKAYPWEDGILGGEYQGDGKECPALCT